MSQACNLCGKSATNRCASCGHVVYCCREHQKQDWKSHKYACKEFGSLKKQGQTWEADVREGVSALQLQVGNRAPTAVGASSLCHGGDVQLHTAGVKPVPSPDAAAEQYAACMPVATTVCSQGNMQARSGGARRGTLCLCRHTRRQPPSRAPGKTSSRRGSPSLMIPTARSSSMCP